MIVFVGTIMIKSEKFSRARDWRRENDYGNDAYSESVELRRKEFWKENGRERERERSIDSLKVFFKYEARTIEISNWNKFLFCAFFRDLKSLRGWTRFKNVSIKSMFMDGNERDLATRISWVKRVKGNSDFGTESLSVESIVVVSTMHAKFKLAILILILGEFKNFCQAA